MSAHSIIFSFCRKGLLPMALLLIMASCRKEAKLTPNPPNVFYTLPQGNHPYDQEILQFFNTYQTYILYKFDSTDFTYSFTNPIGGINYNVFAVAADTNYIQPALDFLHTNCLDLYPVVFLRKTLPFKILLASGIGTSTARITNGVVGFDTAWQPLSSMAGSNHITFGVVNSTLPNLTTAQTKTARGSLQAAYWQQAMQNKMIERPVGFDSLTNYASLNLFNLNQNGVFALYQNASDPYLDFMDYIKAITSTDSTTISNTWLSPGVDVNGMFKLKYNVIVNYYLNTYGFNLQAIGNLP